MADLIEKTAATGLLPVTHGTLTLSETVTPLTSVMPFKGRDKSVRATLGAWPATGRAVKSPHGPVLWSGRGQAFVCGVAPDGLDTVAAVTDQSDAWCVLVLEGDGLEGALARLTPLDLNPAVFKRGNTARSLLGHMNALFHRVSAKRIEILVFRSMAKTAVHELEHAMKSIAARQSL